jgi:hypothetical protein
MKHFQDLAALAKASLQLYLYKLPGSIINLYKRSLNEYDLGIYVLFCVLNVPWQEHCPAGRCNGHFQLPGPFSDTIFPKVDLKCSSPVPGTS